MLPLVGLNFDLLPSRKFGNNDNLAIFKIKMHHQNPFKVFDKYRSEFDINFKQSHDGRVNFSSGLESNSQSAQCMSTNNGKDSLKSIMSQGKSNNNIIDKTVENANKILESSTGSSNNLQNLLLIHPKVFNWTSDSICCYTPKGVVFRKIVYDKPVEFINDEAVNNKKQIIEQYNLLLRNIVPQNRIPNPIVYNMNKVNKAPKVIRKNFTKRSEFKIVYVPIKKRDVQRPVLTAKTTIKVSKNHYAVLLQCLTDLKFNLDVARPAAGFLVKIARMHAKIQLLKAMNSTRVYSPNIIASADIKNRAIAHNFNKSQLNVIYSYVSKNVNILIKEIRDLLGKFNSIVKVIKNEALDHIYLCLLDIMYDIWCKHRSKFTWLLCKHYLHVCKNHKPVLNFDDQGYILPSYSLNANISSTL